MAGALPPDILGARVGEDGAILETFTVANAPEVEGPPELASRGNGKTLVTYARFAPGAPLSAFRVFTRWIRVPQELGGACDVAEDCASGVCDAGACAMPSTGGSGGAGGMGGGSSSKCAANPAPAEIPATVFEPINQEAEIKSDLTLTADKVWTLKYKVHVRAGVTLTIEPCTTIVGDAGTLGTLIIDPGAKIIAEGTADEPIVFTSQAEPGDRQAGDWGGVILLGKAPINVTGGKANIEGLTPTEDTLYGGDNPDDNSGSLKYVRIEYSGVVIGNNNEINGLTLGGVGRGTQLEYIQVRNTLDDCFEFFGGAVNGKHLVCTANQDDGFDWDFGYSGNLQFLVLQQDQAFPDDTNGFESDNDAMGSTNMPIANPTIYNATFIGHNADKQQFGWLARRSTKGSVYNAIFTNFEACVDIRDETGDPNTITTLPELKNSICFGNKVHNIAYPEDGSDTTVNKNDDKGLDEVAWFKDPARMNAETDPKLVKPLDAAAPDFRPKETLTTNAAAPPNDKFFDPSATYIGAFKSDDTWMTGKWLSFVAN